MHTLGNLVSAIGSLAFGSSALRAQADISLTYQNVSKVPEADVDSHALIYSCVQRPSCALVDSEKMSQAAMNMAAITGPMTKPLSPKVARPPSVEISTT